MLGAPNTLSILLYKLHQTFRIIFLFTLITCLTVLTIEARRTLVQARSTLSQTQQEIQHAGEELKGTSANLNAVLIQAGLASYEIQAASREQRSYWAKNSKETHKVLASLNTLVDHADLVITANGVELLKNQDKLGLSLNTFAGDLARVGTLTDDLDRTVNHANGIMYANETTFTDTLTSIKESAAHVDQATDELAHASKDVADKVHQMTRPVAWYKSAAGWVLKVGSEVGQMWVAF